jgi:proteic killer suppression protein
MSVCCVVRNNIQLAMIRSFRHKGLRQFFEKGTLSGIQAHHANRLRMQLAALDTATGIEDMNIAGFRLHALKGQDKGRWSIWVNGNWRLTFEYRDGDFHVLDYEDYH